jgi:hypothetical protein
LTLLRKLAIGGSIDAKSMSVTAILNTPAEDREGDIIEPAGIDTTLHRKNPVVFFDHWQPDKDRGVFNLPVGKSEDESGLYTVKLDGGRLIGTTYFSQKHPYGEAIFRLYEDRILRAWSVAVKIADAKPRRASVRIAGYTPRHITKSALAEYSAVGIGCNPDALTVRLQKGFGITGPGGKDKEQVLKAALSPYTIPPATWANGWTFEAKAMNDGETVVAEAVPEVVAPPTVDTQGVADAVTKAMSDTFTAKIAEAEVAKANAVAECDILRKQLVAAQADSAAAKTELAGVRSEVETLRKHLAADAKAAARFKAESEKLAHEFYRLTGTKLVA